MPDAHFERNKAMLRVSLLFTALACGDAFMAPVSKPFIATPRVATAPVMIFGFGGFGKSVSRGIRRGGFPKLTGGDGGAGAGGVGDGGEVAGGGTGDDDGKGENPLTVLWNDYVRLLDEKPLLMKALTSFTGFAIGDILAQTFIQKEEAFSWRRLLRLASFGFLVHGTTSHWFYGMLDGKIPGTGAVPVFSKVFIDQVLWNPIFGIMFFSYVAMLELKGVGYVVDKVQNELWTSVSGSWRVWPLAHLINFRFIPSSQRVLYINTIQIFYNCFLSVISNRGPKAETA